MTYRCPSNTAVQVYNYQHKTARVVFGPNLVVLDPHENFNVLFLSGKSHMHMHVHVHTCSHTFTYTYTYTHTHTRTMHAWNTHTLIHSAGKPKKQGALISFCVMLGPDFISDSIIVETADHARLRIAIAMNNIFRVSFVVQLVYED